MGLKEVFEVNNFKNNFLVYLVMGNLFVALIVSWKGWGVFGIELFLFPFSTIMLLSILHFLGQINFWFIFLIVVVTLILVILFDVIKRNTKKGFFTFLYILLHIVSVALGGFQLLF